MRVLIRVALVVLTAALLTGCRSAAPAAAAARPLPPDIERLPADQVPRLQPPAEIVHNYTPLRVKVLVLDFNPWIPGPLHAPDQPDAPPRGLREVGGWNDPRPLAAGFMEDMCAASGGLLQYEIAEWLVVRRFQKKVDGFLYTPETYMASLRQGTNRPEAWRKPDGLDYPAMVAEFDLVRRVESGEIDEVWMMGIPYFGYWEACMVGQGAFDVNGQPYDQVPCRRRFVIFGFNVERGVAEMIHDLCHRAEATMSRISGGWQSDQLTTNWARFAANEHQSGTAAVGTCHYPPNGEKDYDYANPRFVTSTADDWLNYPALTGLSRSFNCEEWRAPYVDARGRPDYHRNYMRWWFAHLPRAPGADLDGRLNNWWEYIYDFNAYDEHGAPLPGVAPPADPHARAGHYRRPH